jgi:hypothetical protein
LAGLRGADCTSWRACQGAGEAAVVFSYGTEPATVAGRGRGHVGKSRSPTGRILFVPSCTLLARTPGRRLQDMRLFCSAAKRQNLIFSSFWPPTRPGPRVFARRECGKHYCTVWSVAFSVIDVPATARKRHLYLQSNPRVGRMCTGVQCKTGDGNEATHTGCVLCFPTPTPR